jgi:hypothetical protein
MNGRSKAEIEELLEAYAKRGEQTRVAFCEQHGIRLSMFAYYRRRHGKAAVRLARVKVEPQPSSAGFALRLANGRRIECGAKDVAELIRIAEAM